MLINHHAMSISSFLCAKFKIIRKNIKNINVKIKHLKHYFLVIDFFLPFSKLRDHDR